MILYSNSVDLSGKAFEVSTKTLCGTLYNGTFMSTSTFISNPKNELELKKKKNSTFSVL